MSATQLGKNFKNTIAQVGSLLGRKFDDPRVQELRKTLPFKLAADEDGFIDIELKFRGEAAVFKPTQAMAMLLTGLKETVTRNIGKEIVDVVISCPRSYNNMQRNALRSAAAIAGLHCQKTLNSTTAAGITYGIYKQDLDEKVPRHVAMTDIGYTHTEVSVIAFTKGHLKVVATSTAEVGGQDIDDLLVKHFAAFFLKKYKVDANERPRAMVRLYQGVQKLKKTLSSNSEAHMSIECFMDDIDVKGMMKRDEFEELCAPIFEKIRATIAKAVEESKVDPKTFHACEVIGGTSRIPIIQNYIKDIFGQEPSKTLNASECVAKGCALQSAMLSPLFKVREYSVVDFNNYSINLNWDPIVSDQISEDGGPITPSSGTEIFPRGDKVSTKKVLNFFRKESFTINAAYNQNDTLPAGTDLALGSFLVHAPPTRASGKATKIKVSAGISQHGTFFLDSATANEESEVELTEKERKEMAVKLWKEKKELEMEETAKAEEKEGEEKKEKKDVPEPADSDLDFTDIPKVKIVKKKLSVKVDQLSGDNPVEGKVLDALKLREQELEDINKMVVETENLRNEVETYVYDMRDRLSSSLEAFCDPSVIDEFRTFLNSTEDWLYEDGEDAPKGAYSKKLKELHAFGDPVVSRKDASEKIPVAFKGLTKHCNEWLLLANTEEEKYAHITAEERGKVEKLCNACLQYREDTEAKLAQQKKYEVPCVDVAIIQTKVKELRDACTPIMSRPKPVVIEEEKKEEEEKKRSESTRLNSSHIPLSRMPSSA
eukprot:TRINITY_DN3503_c0_g1_i2.p1 TRINITY_DN3503_c0_g1~~TRINITY_DN3503_c0_g1_i2.p1  ORF type:complete len:827 (+),score=361.42 TRINITY_DN3503_c0_g1_i2:171-2483(+)